jgi:hypothetical protein
MEQWRIAILDMPGSRTPSWPPNSETVRYIAACPAGGSSGPGGGDVVVLVTGGICLDGVLIGVLGRMRELRTDLLDGIDWSEDVDRSEDVPRPDGISCLLLEFVDDITSKSGVDCRGGVESLLLGGPSMSGQYIPLSKSFCTCYSTRWISDLVSATFLRYVPRTYRDTYLQHNYVSRGPCFPAEGLLILFSDRHIQLSLCSFDRSTTSKT